MPNVVPSHPLPSDMKVKMGKVRGAAALAILAGAIFASRAHAVSLSLQGNAVGLEQQQAQGVYGSDAMGVSRLLAAVGHPTPDDAKITANVEAELGKHWELEAPDRVHVQTLNHVVYLTGDVSSGLQSRIAASVATRVKGVSRVENSISVDK